jgi:hypothetical protein
MAVINVLELIKRGGLTKQQKDHLKQRLRSRMSELERAIKAVERGLAALGEKPKRKKIAKRRGRRRAKR